VIFSSSGGPFSNTYYEGHVRIFQLSNENEEWVQVGNTIDGQTADGNFGAQVTISSDGNIVAVGQPDEVTIFRLENGSWIQLGEPIEGNEISLALDGLVAAVRNPSAGEVRILKFLDEEWLQIGGSIEKTSDSSNRGNVDVSKDGHVVVTVSEGSVRVFADNVDGPSESFKTEATSSSSIASPQLAILIIGTILVVGSTFTFVNT
jgi:hypothetical protein